MNGGRYDDLCDRLDQVRTNNYSKAALLADVLVKRGTDFAPWAFLQNWVTELCARHIAAPTGVEASTVAQAIVAEFCTVERLLQFLLDSRMLDSAQLTFPANLASTFREYHDRTRQRQEDKIRYGEILFNKVFSIYPPAAGKITGMFLELEQYEVENLISDEKYFIDRVEEAKTILKDNSLWYDEQV